MAGLGAIPTILLDAHADKSPANVTSFDIILNADEFPPFTGQIRFG
jgi:hypothetical protein